MGGEPKIQKPQIVKILPLRKWVWLWPQAINPENGKISSPENLKSGLYCSSKET